MKVEESDNKVIESNSPGKPAVVGKTLQFDGNIKGEEDLIIEGTVEGTITLTNAEVIVEKCGLVEPSTRPPQVDLVSWCNLDRVAELVELDTLE